MTSPDVTATNLPLGGNKVAIQQLLAFGREIQKLFNELCEEGVAQREELRGMLQVRNVYIT